MRAHVASVFVDDRRVVDLEPHFPARGRGGVVALNEYRSTVYFKLFAIEEVALKYGECGAKLRRAVLFTRVGQIT